MRNTRRDLFLTSRGVNDDQQPCKFRSLSRFGISDMMTHFPRLAKVGNDVKIVKKKRR